MENLEKLVREIINNHSENQWIEFKHNNYDPKMTGEDIAALANGALLCDRQYAYMIWGVDDKTRDIVGTNVDITTLKKGNQELENWLRSLLSSNIDFDFDNTQIDGKYISVIRINKPSGQIATFEKEGYIRIGSYTKKLRDYPAIQAQLWDKIKNNVFESGIAMSDVDTSCILKRLDYTYYFDLTDIPIPENAENILHYLLEEGIITKQDDGLFSITNMGAILFAKSLKEYDRLSRKSIRIVKYDGKNRLQISKEMTEDKGYVTVFEETLKYIDALLPTKENMESGIRTTESQFPKIAIREALANALIHQDFTITGSGPLVEIFDNRIEITNPGTPLIEISRIIDNPPRSRNEKLADLMRRLRICEELGSGWDRMVIACEAMKISAPKIEIYADNTKITLQSTMRFSEMSVDDRLWACYMHACVRYVQGEQITNSTIRERFGLEESSSAGASRLIKDAVDNELIKPVDATTAPRYMRYIPIWA